MTEAKNYCPYLRRAGESFGYPIFGYCEGPSVCALRVVSLGEFQNFCITGDYRLCPLYHPEGETEKSAGAAAEN